MKRYRAIADYYDYEYAHQAYLDQDVPFFLQQLPKRRQDVLELAVGTARAAIPIAEAGHHVVGVDYARDMLAIARRKRQSAGLSDRQLELIQRDVLRLDLGHRFNSVCIFFNTFLSFTTLAQQDQLLQVVLRHLKPRGHFWLDIFQPNLELLAQEVSIDLDPHTFYVPRYDRTVYQSTDVRRDAARQLQHVTFHYRWFDAAGEEHHEQVEFDLTYIFPRELQILLERNGLKIDRLWGDYNGSPLKSDSPRMIGLCSRQGAAHRAR